MKYEVLVGYRLVRITLRDTTFFDDVWGLEVSTSHNGVLSAILDPSEGGGSLWQKGQICPILKRTFWRFVPEGYLGQNLPPAAAISDRPYILVILLGICLVDHQREIWKNTLATNRFCKTFQSKITYTRIVATCWTITSTSSLCHWKVFCLCPLLGHWETVVNSPRQDNTSSILVKQAN